jgi:hypothetical protein
VEFRGLSLICGVGKEALVAFFFYHNSVQKSLLTFSSMVLEPSDDVCLLDENKAPERLTNSMRWLNLDTGRIA